MSMTGPTWNDIAPPNKLEAMKRLPFSAANMFGEMKTL